KEYIGFRWNISLLVSMALYEKNTQVTQNFYDTFTKFIDCLDLNEIIQIAQEFNMNPLLKKFPQNIGVITALIRARFFNFG
ncbi:MAG: hypothetical protein WC894_00870, partial [Patescibacteria group bacterium]